MNEPAKERELIDPLEWADQHWRGLGLPNPRLYKLQGSIYRLNQMVMANIEDVLRPFGLNPTSYFALLAISTNEQGLRMSHVARYVKTHPTTATLVVDRLCKLGLVERKDHENDRRITMAVVTPAGMEMIHEASVKLAASHFGFAGEVPEETRAAIVALCALLRRDLGDWTPAPKNFRSEG
jgi:DNA-binding MarR family transcriptional regulator